MTPEIPRKKTKKIRIGRVVIGGGMPIAVQSMTKCPTTSLKKLSSEIRLLEEAGCDIVRLGIPDLESARALRQIKKCTKMPLVADIHFDWRLAVESIKSGADKIRINPGNIGDGKKLKAVLAEASAASIPVRIGLNSGSLPKKYLLPGGGFTPESFAGCASDYIKLFESMDFTDIVISLKSTDIFMTYRAYRAMAEITRYPLHIGITESGFGTEGLVRSSIGIGLLLFEGIGDTIRVSLTDTSALEAEAGREILKTLNLSSGEPVLISCPTCARREMDVAELSRLAKKQLKGVKKGITFAVMGCSVNGPGEARHADYGVAGGKGKVVIFSRGSAVKTVEKKDIARELKKLVGEIKNE